MAGSLLLPSEHLRAVCTGSISWAHAGPSRACAGTLFSLFCGYTSSIRTRCDLSTHIVRHPLITLMRLNSEADTKPFRMWTQTRIGLFFVLIQLQSQNKVKVVFRGLRKIFESYVSACVSDAGIRPLRMLLRLTSY